MEPNEDRPRRKRVRSRRKSNTSGGSAEAQTSPQIVDSRADLVLHALASDFEKASRSGVPHLFLLTGETGRGKTYALQGLYDALARKYPGYWLPGLRPDWPPDSVFSLRSTRKSVTPPPELRQATEPPPFLWLSVSCSGSMDAQRLDPAAHLLRQLQIVIGDAVQAENRRIERSRARRAVALDGLIDVAGQVLPPLSPLVLLLQTVHSLLTSMESGHESALDVERRRAFNALTQYADIVRENGGTPPTVVVVVDDAVAAPDDVWRIVSSLFHDPDGPGNDPNRLSPRFIDEHPPLPIFIVATAWEYAMGSERSGTTFDQWLSEFGELGLPVTRMLCRQFTPAEAERRLLDWRHGPEAELRQAIVKHIADADTRGQVNPLVLAEHVAWVEDQRDPFEHSIRVSAESIDALSTSPYQHIIERLEALREESRETHAILVALTRIGASAPGGMLAELHRRYGARTPLDEVIETLVAHRILLSPRPASKHAEWFASLNLDADIYNYLVRENRSGPIPIQVPAAAKLYLLGWAEKEKNALLVGVHGTLTDRRRLLKPICKVADIGDTPTVETKHIIQTVLSRTKLSLERWEACTDPALRVLLWLFDGAKLEVPAALLVQGIEQLGASWASLEATRALLANRQELSPPEIERLLQVLRPHSGLAEVQNIVVRLLTRSGGSLEAQEMLTNADSVSPQAAIEVSYDIEKTQSAAAAYEFLERWGTENGTLRRRLASLKANSEGPEAALAILRPDSGSWTEGHFYAELLGRSGRTVDRIAYLQGLARNNPRAACELASDYQAMSNTEGVRSVLEFWADSNAEAASHLAMFEWTQDRHAHALALLAPFDLESSRVAPTLARMLDQIGEHGLRFKQDHGVVTRVEAPVPPQPGTGTGAHGSTAGSAPAVLVTPSEITDFVESQQPGSDPRSVARSLLDQFGNTTPTRDAVKYALVSREQLPIPHAQVAFFYLRPYSAESQGLACGVADIAFLAGFPDARAKALEALLEHSESRHASLLGRRLSLQVLGDGGLNAVEQLFAMTATDFWFSLVGASRMLGSAPGEESAFWRRLVSHAVQAGSERKRYLLVSFAAGRVLFLARAMGLGTTSDILDLIESLFEGLDPEIVVRFLEQSLQAFIVGSEVDTPLRGYQAISQYEVICHLADAVPDLERRLVSTIQRSEQRQYMPEWAPHSRVASLVCDLVE